MAKSSYYLRQARKLLTDPTHWTKEYYARTASGLATDPTSPNATCFCMLGAIRKVTNVDLTRIIDAPLMEHLYSAIAPYNYRFLTDFNDNVLHTHEEVLAVFDAAIEIAKSKGD